MSDPTTGLGKRERQIMEIAYRRGRASASEVLADLEDPPSYSSVRAMLRYLEDKGYLRHEQDGPRYIYIPVMEKGKARGSALGHVVRTFFDNSIASTVAALLEPKTLTQAEYERLSGLLEKARSDEGR